MTGLSNTLQDSCKREKYKVAIALSGGIDSTASALILKQRGYSIVGLLMQIQNKSFRLPKDIKACFGPVEEERIERTKLLCKKLEIPFYIIDLRKEFEDIVLQYFRKEYLSGRTPNPCVICNERIKFGFLIQKAEQKGIEFDLFATGHHARVEKKGHRYCLKKGKDKNKDQSYFLYRLNQSQLSRTIFPAGDFYKRELKEMIKTYGIEIREESQDFISHGSYSVLFRKDEVKKGYILNKEGKILGKHKGIIHYTVGQRKGLGISSSRPLYVIKINAQKNEIIVGYKEDTYSKEMKVKDINLVSADRMDSPFRAKVKIRQQHKEACASLYPVSDGIKVIFDEPQMAITPGQSAVFYKEDMVLGGGIIESSV